jgi:hypothetical protein
MLNLLSRKKRRTWKNLQRRERRLLVMTLSSASDEQWSNCEHLQVANIRI